VHFMHFLFGQTY